MHALEIYLLIDKELLPERVHLLMKDIFLIGLILLVVGGILTLVSMIPEIRYVLYVPGGEVGGMRLLGIILIVLGLFFVIGAIKNR